MDIDVGTKQQGIEKITVSYEINKIKYKKLVGKQRNPELRTENTVEFNAYSDGRPEVQK